MFSSVESSLKVEERTLQSSLQNFHNNIIQETLSRCQSKLTSREGHENGLIQEIKKRWLEKLETKVGKYSINEETPSNEKEQTRQYKPLPSSSSSLASAWLAPLSPPVVSMGASYTIGAPKPSVKLSFPSNRSRTPPSLTNPTETSIGNNSNTTKDLVQDYELSKPWKRRRIIGTLTQLSMSNKEAIVGTGQETIIAGMKIYVYWPKFYPKIIPSSQLSISEYSLQKNIVATRIVHILRENIQTASKIITHTKLLLRRPSGQEITIFWPSSAAHTDRDVLYNHLLEQMKVPETAFIRNDTEESQINDADKADTTADHKQEDTSSLQTMITNWIVEDGYNNNTQNSNSNDSNHSEVAQAIGSSFADNLLAEVGDLSWCNLPMFEAEEVEQQPQQQEQRLFSINTTSKNSTSTDIPPATNSQQPTTVKAMLTTGEIISQDILDDVERYFQSRCSQRPTFVLESTTVSENIPNIGHQRLTTLEPASIVLDESGESNDHDILLHPEDDPFAVLPTPDMTIIGKASKVVCGEHELHLVLKDVYIHHIPSSDTPEGTSAEIKARDMILPEVSIRLESTHLFGKM